MFNVKFVLGHNATVPEMALGSAHNFEIVVFGAARAGKKLQFCM
jgi:hypothetical protein